MKSVFSEYINLTKPRVMILVILSGAAAMILEGSLLAEPLGFLLVLVALYLSGGSANALNMYFERDIDSRMSRTRNRRPLPKGSLKPWQALAFAIGIGIISIALFVGFFNVLSALLALATILFYGLFYTLVLKPNTDQNIVIGGAAGAMAPIITWAAATGGIAWTPLIIFMIVFIWTPPHFWALALYYRDDYKNVGLPMLPVVRGENSALKHILYYTIALVAISLALIATSSGPLYAIAAIALGAVFVKKSLEAKRTRERRMQRALFGYSIVYLFVLFFAMIIDSFITWGF